MKSFFKTLLLSASLMFFTQHSAQAQDSKEKFEEVSNYFKSKDYDKALKLTFKILDNKKDLSYDYLYLSYQVSFLGYLIYSDINYKLKDEEMAKTFIGLSKDYLDMCVTVNPGMAKNFEGRYKLINRILNPDAISLSSENRNANVISNNAELQEPIPNSIAETANTKLNAAGNSQAGREKTVILVVNGQGNTPEEAEKNALRSAIEQAFGAFISAKTEVLNDSLVKDEIVTVANGNIQKYEKISEIKLPNGNYATSLRATVSVDKLRSFVQSKGISVQFNGGVFAMNMAMQEMYKKNELIAWKNTRSIIDQLIPSCFNYQLDVSDPVLYKESKYKVDLVVSAVMNNNYKTVLDVLTKYILSVSMSETDAYNYEKSGHKAYNLAINDTLVYLRNEFVTFELVKLPWQFKEICGANFTITNGFNSNYSLSEFHEQPFSFFSRKPEVTLFRDEYQYLNDRAEYIGPKVIQLYVNVRDFKEREKLKSLHMLSKEYRTIDNEFNYQDQEDYSNPPYEDTVFELSYFDITNVTNFLFFKLSELRDIDEIKNTKEYKIELVYKNNNQKSLLTNE
jgi:hypothetical protein